MSNENVPANPAETPEVVAAVQETNRLKAIKANVEQWRSALQESARVAVEALSKEAPIVGQHELPLEERSKILGEAIHQIRELVRPRPGTVAFLEEHGWYHVHSTYHTPKAAVDFVLGNPPFGTAEPTAKPLSPDAPDVVRGEDRHLTYGEAIAILARLETHRSRTLDEVSALMMGANRMLKRHFQKQKNWARRRAEAAKQQADDNKPFRVAPLSPEEELADTIARQKGEEVEA